LISGMKLTLLEPR